MGSYGHKRAIYNKWYVHTLAMRELFDGHTAEYIKNTVKDILRHFHIFTFQIYSITTDNAANMLKSVKLVRDENIESYDSESDTETHSGTDTNSQQIEWEAEETNPELANEEDNVLLTEVGSVYSMRCTHIAARST